MRRKSVMRLAPWTIICVLVVPLAFGSVGLPYTEGFEGGALGADWTTNGMGALEFPSDAPAGGGDKSCRFERKELTLNVTPSTFDNVWAQVYAKASGSAEEPEASHIDGCTAVFYVDTNATVRVMNGGGSNDGSWVDATNLTDVMTDNQTDWIGFVVHLDYANNQYDLYVKENGTAGADDLTRVASGMGFRQNASELSNFVVETELETLVDAVALGQAASRAGYAGLDEIETDTSSRTTNIWKAIAIAHSGTISGDLGALLLDNTGANDLLQVWYTNGWNEYYNEDLMAPGWTLTTGIEPNLVELSTGSVAYVKHRTDPSPAFHVYAKGYVPEIDDFTTPPPPEGYELYGTDNDNVEGWSTLVWGGGNLTLSGDVDANGGSANLGDDEVGPAGARVFVRDPNSRIYDFRYRFNQQWMRSGQGMDLNLQNGQVVWVQQTNGATVRWNPPAP